MTQQELPCTPTGQDLKVYFQGGIFLFFFNYSFNFYLFIFYSTLCSVQISPGAAGGWADGF